VAAGGVCVDGGFEFVVSTVVVVVLFSTMYSSSGLTIIQLENNNDAVAIKIRVCVAARNVIVLFIKISHV
jgi:hypothetical protein